MLLPSCNFQKELSNQHIKGTKSEEDFSSKHLNQSHALLCLHPLVHCHLRTATQAGWPGGPSNLVSFLIHFSAKYNHDSSPAFFLNSLLFLAWVKRPTKIWNKEKNVEGRKKWRCNLSSLTCYSWRVSFLTTLPVGLLLKLILHPRNLVSCHQLGWVLSPKTQKPYITSFYNLYEVGISLVLNCEACCPYHPAFISWRSSYKLHTVKSKQDSCL